MAANTSYRLVCRSRIYDRLREKQRHCVRLSRFMHVHLDTFSDVVCSFAASYAPLLNVRNIWPSFVNAC